MSTQWYRGLDTIDVKETIQGGIWTALQARVEIANRCPIAHSEVIFRQLSSRRGEYYVLKNGRAKTYLRLSPVEFRLWQQMDGATSVEDLITEHFMRTGEFAHGLVNRLINQLHWKQMLQEEPFAVWQTVRTAVGGRSWLSRLSRPAQVVLTQQLSIGGIDGLVERIYRSVGWLFFTRPAQILFVLVSLLGFVAFVQIIRKGSYVFIGQDIMYGLVLLWVAALFPVLIHELGHALTVKHFGREVPRGGLMLFFGMPAAFVETTDIWLEPRRARLAVTWNGPYTGLIIGGAAALLIWMFPGAAFNGLLFRMAGIAYASVFLNVNPLLRFDGYYLLSDGLDIPSLRERSLDFLRRKLPVYLSQRKRPTREELLFAVYGLLSTLWVVYAVFLAFFFWQNRVRAGLQALLGDGYPLLARLMGLILVLGMVSLLVLMGLGLARAAGLVLANFVRQGGLTRHMRLAFILAGIAVLAGLLFRWVFSEAALVAAPVTGSFLAMSAAWQLRRSRLIHRGSRRGTALALLILALILIAIAQAVHWSGQPVSFSIWIERGGILLVAAAGLALTGVDRRYLGLPLMGLILAGVTLFGLQFALQARWSQPELWLAALLSGIGLWSYLYLRGGARAPAAILLFAGAALLAVARLRNPSLLHLPLTAVALMSAAGLHWVFARLPELTRQQVAGVSSSQQAVGSSVAVLVRRIIAQIFFESGYVGVGRLDRDFTQSMREHGLELAIQGNRFLDRELPRRTAAELTEVYGLALDELYAILGSELGAELGRLALAHGVDLLPWENREVLSELVLSRRSWGLNLDQENIDPRRLKRELLRRVPLFVALEDEELDRIADSLKEQYFAFGETILREGDPGDRFYTVQRGQVSIWQTGSDGIAQQVDRKGPGQYFGEVALVSDRPRNASAIAETPVRLFTLEKEDFDKLVRHHIRLDEQIDSRVAHSWLLRGMPIFDELQSDELDWLALQMEQESLPADTLVFAQGQPGDKFYIVKSGQVRITRQVGGEDIKLASRGPGEYFGEIALLQDQPRSASVCTTVDSDLLSLTAGHFRELMSGYLHFGQAVAQTGSRRLSFVQRAAPA